MNIAYNGRLLHEGMLENGHQVHHFDATNGESLDSILQSFPVPIDLVVWESFGASAAPSKELFRCDLPVAAYCIDSPLNSFWLKHCLKNFDYVFVDQPQCVADLADCGINASWLALPAQKTWFQPRRNKLYDITFVGRTTGFRAKRNNLLKLLQSRFKINIMSGMDIPATQKAFSESRIIINENFFPGLTMRVLQGLSAGTIVFTEKSPYGDDFGFKDKVDLVCYSPDNVLDILVDLTEHYESFADIGANGQKKCAELYSSGRVAANLLSAITANGMRKKNVDEDSCLWNSTVSELLFAQRFGGDFSNSVKSLKEIAASSSDKACDAHILAGDIQARFKGGNSAWNHYMASLEINPSSIGALKLALLFIQHNKPNEALKIIVSWIQNSSGQLQESIPEALKREKDIIQGVLSIISKIYYDLGRKWDMGFQKYFIDPVPDTAFEVASMAWNLSPSTWALDMMSKCLRPYHLQGELLPYMLSGIRAGLLSNREILETARIAFEYYDRDTASTIISDIKKIQT